MIPSCQHFQQTNLQGGGTCLIGEFDGQPSYRSCARCLKWKSHRREQTAFRAWYSSTFLDTKKARTMTQAEAAKAAAEGKIVGGCDGC